MQPGSVYGWPLGKTKPSVNLFSACRLLHVPNEEDVVLLHSNNQLKFSLAIYYISKQQFKHSCCEDGIALPWIRWTPAAAPTWVSDAKYHCPFGSPWVLAHLHCNSFKSALLSLATSGQEVIFATSFFREKIPSWISYQKTVVNKPQVLKHHSLLVFWDTPKLNIYSRWKDPIPPSPKVNSAQASGPASSLNDSIVLL